MKIVQEVLKIKASAKEENESIKNSPKIIIFSQWQPVLSSISEALTTNYIEHKLKYSTKSIEDFKVISYF